LAQQLISVDSPSYGWDTSSAGSLQELVPSGASGSGVLPGDGSPGDRRLDPDRLLCALLAAAFAAIVLIPQLVNHDLWAPQEYDDGVYYAAALNLVHGHLPYGAFAFLQPPGITLLLSPIALLGSFVGEPAAMALARVLVAGCGAVGVTLIWRLTPGERLGRLAAVVAYGLSADVLIASRTVMLEPLVNLGVLLALRQLLTRGGPEQANRRALIISGVIFGVSADIKLFALIYPLVVAAWLVARKEWRRCGWHLAGAAVGFLAVLGPFLAAAPGRVVEDVFLVQMQRPASGGLTAVARISNALGLSALTHRPVPAWAVGLMLALLIAACCAAPRQGPGRIYAGVLVASGLIFLRSPSYFSHYGAFLALPWALLVGVLIHGRPEQSPRLSYYLATALTSLLCLTALAGIHRADLFLRVRQQPSLAAAMRPLVHRHSCVFTDSPSLAIAADVLRPDRPGCRQWVDGRGYALTLLDGVRPAHFYPSGFQSIQHWQIQLRAQLAQADILLLRAHRGPPPEWSRSTWLYVATHFHRAYGSRPGAPWEIWQRPYERVGP
jgi:alpha-1,2-mannosyltransferase